MNCISEKYEIMNELGHGAHAKVYLARHKKLNVLRAVKFIRKNEADSRRYLQEANLIKNLKHPGIPIIYDIEEDEESICIIEEYIAGKSLTAFVLENQNLPLDIVCQYGIQICSVLEYLHANRGGEAKRNGILHLDLKPDNIMIGEDNLVRIIDYDNALAENQKLEKCVGSKGFAAPEQYHRLKLEMTADIYGLGILLLYMSTGGYIQSFAERICNSDLQRIIKKCTRHNPIQRYDNVSKVKQDLQKILNQVSKENSKESLEICLFGIKHGIGTTHISLCLTNYLNHLGIKAVCVDCTETDSMKAIVENGAITPSGTYKLYGAYLLPNYNECINVNLENEYKIVIKDMGMIKDYEYQTLKTVDNKCKTDQCAMIVIGGGKYYEQNELNEVLAQYDNCTCILNHISGKQFYSYIQNNCPKQKMYRMPCRYEWNSSEETTDDVFKELLDELFLKGSYDGKSRNTILRKISGFFKNQ